MSSSNSGVEHLLAPGLPEPAPRFGGFPAFNFIGGHNDPEQIPVDRLAEAAAAVIRRDGAKLAMYNIAQDPLGYGPLRAFVAEKLARHRGIACGADDVLITSGSGQGIGLVNRLFLRPGDTVLVEEYCYGGALRQLRNAGVRMVPVPLDDKGIRPDGLASVLAGLKRDGVAPKYLYTIPTIQNPTGSVLPAERRSELLRLAREYDFLVFEDECYADLVWSGTAPPALHALDPLRVVHIGSFSKTLAPALRVGYAVAAWPVLSRMLACKSDGGTGALDQMVIAEYFSQAFDEHATRLTAVLKAKRDAMVEAVAREFGAAAEPWIPEGGIFLWFKLPDAVDVRKLVRPAANAGIAFNPGPEWAVEPDAATSHLRLCFGLPSMREIEDGVSAFAKVCRDTFGIPAISANVRHA